VSEQWTIERIQNALGSPLIADQALAEVTQAPADDRAAVIVKWQRIAEDISNAATRARDLAPYEASGQPLPGQWVDRTDQVLAEAERIRARGAA
jgi:hypothetical protein